MFEEFEELELKPKYKKIEALKAFFNSVALDYYILREQLIDARLDDLECRKLVFAEKQNRYSKKVFD